MSGFDDPRNIACAKRQINELCSVISKEHGFHLREMLILFFADIALCYVVEAEYQAYLRGELEAISLEELRRQLDEQEE